MGKSKTKDAPSHLVPLKKDSFARLFEKWCETGGESMLTHTPKDREDVERQSENISTLRLMRVEATLDLHGYTRLEAKEAATLFLKEEYSKGRKKVEIVTGKGIHSADGVSVVKESVIEAIKGLNIVREYYFPRERYGGSGTIHVIFKR